jgi:membrane associated rhomboid family serine protease
MHQASVGFHCPECAGRAPQHVHTAQSLMRQRRAVIAPALVLINLAVFVLDMPTATATGIGDLGRDGALFGPAVAAGDWWRPVTSGFVHAGFMHVGFNMFLLWLLGQIIEPAIGRIGFIALYFMSLLGGSFLVLVMSYDALTVGASGAVFGLMGAAFVGMRARGIDPFSTGIGPLLVINLILTFVVPGISIGGHIGGLVAGAIGGWLFFEVAPRTQHGHALITLVCGGAAVGLYVACLQIAEAGGSFLS